MNKRNIFSNWILLVLVVAVFAFWKPIIRSDENTAVRENKTCIWFLDVGQGDSAYIRTQNGKDILIDAGAGNKVLSGLQKAMPFLDKSIDLAIATHSDQDHIGGMDEVLKNYEVREIWWNGFESKTKTFKDFWQAVQSEIGQGALIKIPALFETKIFPDAQITLVYIKDGKFDNKDDNENSLVVELSEGEFDALFMADLPQEFESQISLKDIEVLKVGHHGSKTSTSDWLLDNFKPEKAVISVGKNSYGHPHQATLQKLQKRGIEILRTDEKRDIKICVD